MSMHEMMNDRPPEGVDQHRTGQTPTAKPAQPDTWALVESACLRVSTGEDPQQLFKHGVRTALGVLRRYYPPRATCMASGQTLEACKACDEAINDYLAADEPNSTHLANLRSAQLGASAAIAKAEPKG